MSEIWKPSVTVAAVIESNGLFLMVEEQTLDGLAWNQPAGHLDPHESLVDAVVREVMEETAHPFAPTGLLGTYLASSRSTRTGRDVTYLRFAFVGTVGAPREGQALDQGIVRAVWRTPDEIWASKPRSPLVHACLEDYLSGKPIASLGLLVTHPSALGDR